MPRPPRPDDLYRLRIATEPRLSPDGRAVVVTLQTVAPGYDGYRTALWLVSTAEDGPPPRQLTLGVRHDHHPRFSPDGSSLAFLSDRRTVVEEEPARSEAKGREDTTQVHLLRLDGGEARRLTDLPRGVTGFEWSPDGSRLVVTSPSHAATWDADRRRRGMARRTEPGTPPLSDYRFIDRLNYMLNGVDFVYDRIDHLWLVEVATGTASRLTDGPVADTQPAWSPDGGRIAFTSNRRRDADLLLRSDIHVVDIETKRVTPVTAGPKSVFGFSAVDSGRRLARRDGQQARRRRREPERRVGLRRRWVGCDADRRPQHVGPERPDAARADDQRRDRGRAAGPDRVRGRGARVRDAPRADGAYELWRVALADGRVERLTNGRHQISGWDVRPGPRGRPRIAYLRSTPTEPPDAWFVDGAAVPRRLSSFNAEVVGELELREAVERHVTVDGDDVQGWLIPAGPGARPTVTEIHGGPHALYGWSPLWEFQVLAANGISVFYSNPRGSEGYGEAFNAANHRDWGPGPARDVLAGVDALVADGLADPDRLGLTGGSYGGYLTSWIVGHDQRFRAAMSCRSVNDMSMIFTTGDISGGDWARIEFESTPWDDPAYFHEISPIAYADAIRTPLLIQHSERDLRTTIGQAEALFTVLRSKRRPVRLLRVPEDTHDLTRSGTPFRRIENLEVVLGWFRHFLVDGKRGMPPLPRIRGGR